MPQVFHINLDGGELPLSMGDVSRETIVQCDDGEIEAVLLAGGMAIGAHSVAIFARLPDGKLAMLQMSARQLMNFAGAVRGRLQHLGVLPTNINPPLAMMAERAKGVVHFSFESPQQSFDYTTDQAKKFWRELRRVAEEST